MSVTDDLLADNTRYAEAFNGILDSPFIPYKCGVRGLVSTWPPAGSPRSTDHRGGLRAQSGRPPRRTSCSTMTFRWISFVHSPTIISGASRK